MAESAKKVVLAYSGGLDTSVILKWLIETYDCEVVTFSADLGQVDDMAHVEANAMKTGASKAYVEDLKEEFVRDYVFPAFRANAIYEGTYLLGTSIARPLIAKRMVEAAEVAPLVDGPAEEAGRGAPQRGVVDAPGAQRLRGHAGGAARPLAAAKVGQALPDELMAARSGPLDFVRQSLTYSRSDSATVWMWDISWSTLCPAHRQLHGTWAADRLTVIETCGDDIFP